MSNHKISPWIINIDEDESFIKSVQHVGNLHNLQMKRSKSQSQSHDQLIINSVQLKKTKSSAFSQNYLQSHSNHGAKQEHQPMKTVLGQKSLKQIKTEPEVLFNKMKLMELLSVRNEQKQREVLSAKKKIKKIKQETMTMRKSQKQIYYNLTELNYNKKCYTELSKARDAIKLRSLKTLVGDKIKQKLSVSQKLLLERKVYVLQSGERSLKCGISKDKCFSKKVLRTDNNWQEELRFIENKYERKKRKETI